jgi:hypothetical protein
LSFDGIDDYISFTSIASTARTQAGWFYFSQQASVAGNLKYLFSNLIQHNANDYIYHATTNDLFYWAPSLNTWYYIVFTFPDNTNSIDAKLYVNTIRYSISQQGVNHSIADVSRISTNGSNAFNGKIDDVRIFNAAMPTSQIQQNYFAGLNKLFAKNQITQLDYQQSLVNLSANNFVEN